MYVMQTCITGKAANSFSIAYFCPRRTNEFRKCWNNMGWDAFENIVLLSQLKLYKNVNKFEANCYCWLKLGYSWWNEYIAIRRIYGELFSNTMNYSKLNDLTMPLDAKKNYYNEKRSTLNNIWMKLVLSQSYNMATGI